MGKRKKTNTECKKCKWSNDCVNVGKFEDGDCLQFKNRPTRGKTIQHLF
jgi:hypothetical protein